MSCLFFPQDFCLSGGTPLPEPWNCPMLPVCTSACFMIPHFCALPTCQDRMEFHIQPSALAAFWIHLLLLIELCEYCEWHGYTCSTISTHAREIKDINLSHCFLLCRLHTAQLQRATQAMSERYSISSCKWHPLELCCAATLTITTAWYPGDIT